MRQLSILAFDVGMALAVLLGGAAIPRVSHAPGWLQALPILPALLWIRWRNGLEGLDWPWIVALALGFTGFFFVCEELLQIGQGWQFVLTFLFACGIRYSFHLTRLNQH